MFLTAGLLVARCGKRRVSRHPEGRRQWKPVFIDTDFLGKGCYWNIHSSHVKQPWQWPQPMVSSVVLKTLFIPFWASAHFTSPTTLSCPGDSFTYPVCGGGDIGSLTDLSCRAKRGKGELQDWRLTGMEKETGEIYSVILQLYLGLVGHLGALHALPYAWHWPGQQLHNCAFICSTVTKGGNREQEIHVAVPERGEGTEGCYRVGMSFCTFRAVCWGQCVIPVRWVRGPVPSYKPSSCLCWF